MKISVQSRGDIFRKADFSSVASVLAGKLIYEKIPPIIMKEGSLIVYQKQIKDLCKTYGFVDYDTVELKENKTEYSIEHNHKNKEARWTVRGKGDFFVPFDSFLLKFEVYPGDFILINEGVNHWYELPNDSKEHCLIRLFSSEEGRS